MALDENNKLQASHVRWLANNNIVKYRSNGQAAPAEIEISKIAEDELEHIQRRFMHEHGINIYDAPDQDLVRQWLEVQMPTDKFYGDLEELKKIFNINQIVSILKHIQTSGVITLRTTIVSKSKYSVAFVYRHMS